jgi:DNA repair protein RadD
VENDRPAATAIAVGAAIIDCPGGQPVDSTPSPNLQKRPQLWPYQLDAIERIKGEISRGRRPLLVAPTGSGKTLIAAELIDQAVARGEPVVFVDHRRELTEQTSQKLYDVGCRHGIIQAGFPARPGEKVQVCSIQTLHARAVRSRTISMPPAGLLIIDEAHHVRAGTYMRLIRAYPDAAIVGLTATPCRGDGRGLGNAFQTLIECPGVAELTKLGYLVPVNIFAPVRPNLSGIRVERGDYVESQLAQRMNTAPLVGDIVDHWLRLGEHRRTVVFTVNVAHSVHVRDEFRRSGIIAEHIDGSTPLEERKTILASLKSGLVEIVCNCAVLTEGWDRPEASCLVLARPTKSLGLYRQMVGRILRPADGKTDALILDHSGAVFQHGFPDDEIVWTLREDKRAENKAHAARGYGHAPALTTCPECSAIRFEGQPCPVCDWHPVTRPKPVEVAAGELGHVSRDRAVHALPHDRLVFHRQLAWIARQRGYLPGWVGHKFKEKFGVWPPQYPVDPLEPTASTPAWVRGQARAYAKSQSATQPQLAQPRPGPKPA